MPVRKNAISAIIGRKHLPALFARLGCSPAKNALLKILAAVFFTAAAKGFDLFASKSIPDFKYNGYGPAIIIMAALCGLRWGAATLILIVFTRVFVFKDTLVHDGLINTVNLGINAILIFGCLLIANKRAASQEHNRIENGVAKALASVVRNDLQDSVIFDSDMRFIAASDSWVKEFLPEHYQSNYVGLSHYDVTPWAKERFEADHKLVLSGRSIHRDTHVFTDAFGRGHICSWKAIPWHKADGSIGGIFISGLNQKALFEATRRQAALITELNHRTKNTLAMVHSIARQIEKTSTSSQFIERYCARIVALARTHDLIMQMNGKPCSLKDLISITTESIPSAETRIHFENSRIHITNDDAMQALGMAFYELLTNAVKHGALSNQTGTISIREDIVDTPTGRLVTLSWDELGGPRIIDPPRASYGLELITDKIEYALSGKVEVAFRPEGFSWHLTTDYDCFVKSEPIQ